MAEKLTKDMVHDRIKEELLASPEMLGKFLDAYGQLSVWFCFQATETNRRELDKAEKRFYEQRRQIEDLEVQIKKLQTSIKSLKQAAKKNDRPLID